MGVFGNRLLRALGALIALAVVTAACGSDDPAISAPLDACEAVPTQMIDELIGEADAQAFAVERLAECRWLTEDGDEEIALRFEAVPDAEIFVDHAIEATDPARVETLSVGDAAVLFEDEAVLARYGDSVALVTGSVETENLIDVLQASIAYLEARDAAA